MDRPLGWGGGVLVKALMLHIVPYSALALLLGLAVAVLAPLAAIGTRRSDARLAWRYGLLAFAAGVFVIGTVLSQFNATGAIGGNPGLLTVAFAVITLFGSWVLVQCFPHRLTGPVAVLAVTGAWFLAVAIWAISQP